MSLPTLGACLKFQLKHLVYFSLGKLVFPSLLWGIILANGYFSTESQHNICIWNQGNFLIPLLQYLELSSLFSVHRFVSSCLPQGPQPNGEGKSQASSISMLLYSLTVAPKFYFSKTHFLLVSLIEFVLFQILWFVRQQWFSNVFC